MKSSTARTLIFVYASLLASSQPVFAHASPASGQDAARAVAPAPDVAQELSSLLLDLSYPPSYAVDALTSRGIDAIERHPASPLTADLVARVLGLAAAPHASPKIWSRLQGLLDQKDLHGLTRLALRSALARRLVVQNKVAEANRRSPRDEYLRAALAIGPFGDAFGDGYGVTESPEYEKPDLAKTMKGRFGHPVRWRAIHARPTSTQLELAPPGLGPQARGTHYALVQIESASTRPAWMQITCTGSFESWWNGERLLAMHRGIDRGPTRQFAPLLLRKGWNALLFKCASSNVSAFAARLVDEQGDALLGESVRIESDATVHEVAPLPAEDIAPPGAFEDGVAWLTSQRTRSDDASVLAALGNLTARQGFGDAGLAMAKDAFESSPDDPRLRVALMATWRMARHVPTDINRSALRTLMRGYDAQNSQAHAWLFFAYVDQAFADDEKEAAIRALDSRLDASPDEVVTLDRKWRLLRSLRWNGDAHRVLEKLASLAPQPHTYLRALADAIDRAGAPRRALTYLDKALARRPGDISLIQKGLALAKKSGQPDRVDRFLAQRWSRDPESRDARRARAAIAVERRQYAKALQILESVQKETPDDADLLERMTDVAYRAGDDAKAAEWAERCLTVRPERHDLRHRLARMRGEARFPELAPWRLDVASAISSFEEDDSDRSSPTTLVLDQMVVRVYADGSQMEETHVLRRVNDRRGVEESESADAAAAADELIALRTITPDGRSWSPHRVSDSFSMPRLAPGVFIEEHYRNTKSAPGLSPIDFVRFFFRGVGKPYRYSRLVVVLPKEHTFGRFIYRNFPTEAVQTQDLGDLRAFVFLRENQPPITQETAMPGVEEIAPWVTLGRDADIAPAIRSWRTQFEALTVPYAEIREKSAELCRGKKTDIDRARAIHDFVHAHTPDASQRTGSPQPVSVLLKAEGPRFWLELALLSAADIAWTPAVIRPYSRAFDPEPDPALRGWDRWPARGALVKPRDAEPYWLILGATRWQPFGALPSHFGNVPTDGCPYLLLEGDVGRPGVFDGPSLSELGDFKVRARVKLREDDAIVEAEIYMPGNTGLGIKERIRTMPEDQRRLAGQQLASLFFRGTMQYQKVTWLGLEDRGSGLRMRYQMLKRQAMRKRGNNRVLAAIIPPRGYTRIFGGRDRRQHPFVFRGLIVDDWEVRIDPGASQFLEVPKGKLVQHEIMTWASSFERDGNELVIRRRAILRPGRIAPEDYQSFLRLCREVDSAESLPISLR